MQTYVIQGRQKAQIIGWVYLLSWEVPPDEDQHYGFRNNVGTFTSYEKVLEFIDTNAMDDADIDILSVDSSTNYMDGSTIYITPPPANYKDFPIRIRNGKFQNMLQLPRWYFSEA